jgi:hypothetical protein
MTNQQKQKLLKEISMVVEKAFRRGFQQGYLAARGKMGSPPPSEKQVYSWRFARHAETHAVCPPGTRYAGERTQLLSRLSCESVGLDAINYLIYELLPVQL